MRAPDSFVRFAVEISASRGSLDVVDYHSAALNARLPDYKPVSVPLRAAVIHLDRTLLSGSSDLPGSRAGRAAPPPLFGLAPRGVFPAGRITPAAVRSYRTISPLPHLSARRYIFCGTIRRTLRFPRPLAGTLPYGDRTFLSRCRERPPVRQPHLIIVAISGTVCTVEHLVLGTNLLKSLQITLRFGVFYS
jgi:hypothetical protein